LKKWQDFRGDCRETRREKPEKRVRGSTVIALRRDRSELAHRKRIVSSSIRAQVRVEPEVEAVAER